MLTRNGGLPDEQIVRSGAVRPAGDGGQLDRIEAKLDEIAQALHALPHLVAAHEHRPAPPAGPGYTGGPLLENLDDFDY